MQQTFKLKNRFVIPLGAFFLIFSLHAAYSLSSSIKISKQWVEVKDVNYFLLYFQQQDFMLGISYALAGAFTIYAFLKFQSNRKKPGIAGMIGGLTLTGALYGGSCFLLGCCGSPMLAVYLGLFGPSFLGFTKPIILITTIFSLFIGFWWIEKKTKECSCVDKDNCK